MISLDMLITVFGALGVVLFFVFLACPSIEKMFRKKQKSEEDSANVARRIMFKLNLDSEEELENWCKHEQEKHEDKSWKHARRARATETIRAVALLEFVICAALQLVWVVALIIQNH